MRATDTLEEVFDFANRTYSYEVRGDAKIVRLEQDWYKAHWDSGFPDTLAVLIVLWDGRETWTEKRPASHHDRYVREHTVLDYSDSRCYVKDGRTTEVTFGYLAPAITATTEDVERMDANLAARQWIKKTLEAASEALKLGVGVAVEVVKGRKVAKGEYEVTRHDIGQYGPYVNLRDAAGKEYKYVSVSNVEVTKPDFARVFDNAFRPDAAERAFNLKLAENGFQDRIDWLVIADYIEEHDYIPSSVDSSGGRYVAQYFAEAIRRLVQDEDFNLTIPDWDVRRHNQRRPTHRRYGY